MINAEQFEKLASNASEKIIPPNYGFMMSNGTIYSPGYYDCVGVVIAGHHFWTQSHYAKPGTRFRKAISRTKVTFAGCEEVYRMLGEDYYNIDCECPEPGDYLQSMLKFLTKYAKPGETLPNLTAIPFAGDEDHLNKLMNAMRDLGIRHLEPVRMHFSDSELGGAEGRILSLPGERKILYHSVSRKKIFEYPIQ